MGQVSLPVLSRKGHYDHWDYNWISTKNYTINFNEDFFLRKFFFLFFMYGVTTHKYFTPVFFGGASLRFKFLKKKKYNIRTLTNVGLNDRLNQTARSQCYVSKIYLCRYRSWVLVYLYIHNMVIAKQRFFRKKRTVRYHSLYAIYQYYAYTRTKYLGMY